MLESIINKYFYFREAESVGGKMITIPKLKTMVDSPMTHADMVEKYGVDKFGKLLENPRLTSQGKFIRKYWLDELPQFYSIFKFEMDLVGIRPKEMSEWNFYTEKQKDECLSFKPGLLGIPYGFPEKFENCNSQKELIRRGIALERVYVRMKKKNRFKTDLIFGSKIAYNIIVKKMRGS